MPSSMTSRRNHSRSSRTPNLDKAMGGGWVAAVAALFPGGVVQNHGAETGRTLHRGGARRALTRPRGATPLPADRGVTRSAGRRCRCDCAPCALALRHVRVITARCVTVRPCARLSRPRRLCDGWGAGETRPAACTDPDTDTRGRGRDSSAASDPSRAEAARMPARIQRSLRQRRTRFVEAVKSLCEPRSQYSRCWASAAGTMAAAETTVAHAAAAAIRICIMGRVQFEVPGYSNARARFP